MDDKIRQLLIEEMKNQLKGLSSLAIGDENRSKAIDDAVKMHQMILEEEKQVDEVDIHKGELNHSWNEQKKERYLKIGITAAEIVLPLIFYGFWMCKGLKFEETGSFTSATFKGLINRFRPTK